MGLVSLWRVKRHEKGLTLEEAGKGIGITKGALSLIERGHTQAKSKTLGQACTFYGCQPGDLYQMSNESREDQQNFQRNVQ